MPSRVRPIVTAKGRFARSLFLSSTFHATLLGVGLAFPVLWTVTRVSRPRATIWAAAGGPAPEVFEDAIEPEVEVQVEPIPFEEPELIPLPVEAEPFPEREVPEPLEAVELLAEELRHPPLEAVFAPAGADTERDAVAEADSTPTPEPPEVEPSEDPPTEPLVPVAVEVPPSVLAQHCPRPRYPARALRLGWHGTVVCSFTVAGDGRVRDVVVLTSSGHDLLDDTVVETLREWRFNPGTRDGVPVEMELIRRFRFELPS